MKAQEVESTCTFGEVHDLGLAGVQVQSERPEDRRRPLLSFLGSFTGRAQDHQIVGITD
jgi:hypothetical protein